MDDETHRYIDKSVEVVSAQNDTRFTKASSEVKDVQAEMSVTKTELGAKVDGVETQVGSLRTELTAKVDGVEAQVGSSKTELTAKVDGVEAQVGSLRTEMTAKVDSSKTELKADLRELSAIVKSQNPLTSWQIFGVVLSAVALAVGIIYGLMMLAGVSFVAPDNQREIVELLEILIAQNEAAASQNPTPEIAPGTQGPDEGGSDSSPSEERN